MTKDSENAIKISVRAWQSFEQGDTDKAKSLYIEALWLFERAESPVCLNVVSVLNRLGLVCEKRREYDEAKGYFERAVGILQDVKGGTRLIRLAVQSTYYLARIRSIQGFYCEAKQLFKRALALAEERLGPEDLETACVLNYFGTLYKRMERYDCARSCYYRALRILEEKLSSEHAQIASVYYNLAMLEHAAGRSHKGEPFARRCVRMRVRMYGIDHPDVASALICLGLLQDAQCKYDSSEQIYHRAITILNYGEGFQTNLKLETQSFHARGEHAEAEWICRRILGIHEDSVAALEQTIDRGYAETFVGTPDNFNVCKTAAFQMAF